MDNLVFFGELMALASAAAWALGAFLFHRLGDTLSPWALALSKSVVAVVLLAIPTFAFGWSPVDKEALGLLVVSGFLGIALGDVCFFASLHRLGPRVLLVLAVLGQVFTVVLAVLLLHEPFSLRSALGVVAVVLGVAAVLATQAGEHQGKTVWIGVVLGLVSMLCMAFSSLLAKVAMRGAADTLQVTLIRMMAGTVGIGLYGVVCGGVRGWLAPLQDRRIASRFLGAVFVVTFGGFWFSMVAFKYAPIAIAATLTSTEPVFALLLAWLWRGERMRPAAVAGTILAVLGGAILCSG